MKELLETPLFGILISLFAFELGSFLNKKTKISLLNPLLVATVFIIFILVVFQIDVETYNIGGDYISFFLGPATVILAVPLYEQMERLKSNWFSILAGIFIGSLSCMLFVIFLSGIFGLTKEILLSVIPKSITTPMGIELSKSFGGNAGITVASIMVTGLTGAVITPLICKIFRIKDKIAKGIAFGTAAHAVGTSRALEEGEIEGAMSSLSIGIAGIWTSLLAPVLVRIFL